MAEKRKLFLKLKFSKYSTFKEKILWNLPGLERISFGPSSVIGYKEHQNKTFM